MFVRTSLAALVIVVGTVFVVGCASPTSPTSARSITASVLSSVAITDRAEAFVPFVCDRFFS